jgi:uncharacterized protein
VRRAIQISALLAALCAFTANARAGTVAVPVEAGGGFSVPVTSVKEARFRTTIRQQYDFSCGSAALATLLSHHYGYAVGEDTVFTEMFSRGDREKIRREGFSLLDLKVYLEAHGFTADGFEASLDQLAQSAIPAIVLVRENGYTHFVVVKGLRNDRVLIGDPSGGTRAFPREQFEAMRINRILFVVTNRTDAARFNAAADWSAAPGAPMIETLVRDGVGSSLLAKRGPSDF